MGFKKAFFLWTFESLLVELSLFSVPLFGRYVLHSLKMVTSNSKEICMYLIQKVYNPKRVTFHVLHNNLSPSLHMYLPKVGNKDTVTL